jgi:hypothetical protein
MARSRQYVSYQNDQGQFYALDRDESNSRATVQVIGSLPATAVKLFNPPAVPFVGTKPPQGFNERYVNAFLSTDPLVRRKFPIGNPAAYAVAVAGNAQINAPYGGQVGDTVSVWNVTSTRPEIVNRVFSFADTGQTDGTTTNVGA